MKLFRCKLNKNNFIITFDNLYCNNCILIESNMAEQSIIFPKINEAIIKRIKCKQEETMREQIVKKLQANRIYSLYNIIDKSCNQNNQNQRKRHLSQIRKLKYKKNFFKREIREDQESSILSHSNIQEENGISQILCNRRLQFNSVSVGKAIKDMKRRQIYSIQKIMNSVSTQFHVKNQEKQVKKYNKRCYTQERQMDIIQKDAIENLQSFKSNLYSDILTTKKLKFHDYSQLSQEKTQNISIIKENKFFSQRKKQKKGIKNSLKITSGWNIKEEALEYL